MQSLIEFIFQSFWHWLGALMLMIVPFNFIVSMIREFSKWSIARKHGWQPTHLPKITNKSTKESETES